MSIADVYQDERLRLLPNPRPFDGYIEHPARVSSTSLISFQRNRYSVPCEWVNAMVSVRVYHDHLMVVSPEGEFIRLKRCFERDQTIYDWTHYIALIERKPGALRNGAPFRTMPEPLRQLQDQLLRHPGGDRVMAQVLNAVTLHGLEAVLVPPTSFRELGCNTSCLQSSKTHVEASLVGRGPEGHVDVIEHVSKVVKVVLLLIMEAKVVASAVSGGIARNETKKALKSFLEGFERAVPKITAVQRLASSFLVFYALK